MNNMANRMKKIWKFFAIILLSVMLLFPVLCGRVFAAGLDDVNIPDIYKQVALNFFEQQYEQLDLDYDNITVELESDLFDSEENVVAKAIVVKRGDKYDYVVLNLATSQIDEFGFDEPSAYEKFSDRIYYTGLLNYFTQKNNKFESSTTHERFSVSAFKKISKNITDKYKLFKNTASKKFRSGSNPLPNPNKDISNGFYDYAQIDGFNKGNGYEFYDRKYCPGVDSGGVDGDIGFMSQSDFNQHFGTDNSCGPTALTNLCIYLDWWGFLNKDGEKNALKDGSAFSTFERFKELTNLDNNTGIYESTLAPAFKIYAEEQNFNYRIKQNLYTFDQFKENLDSYNTIITYINLAGNKDRKKFGHFVLTLGYLQYRYEYQVEHNILGIRWTTTEYKYANYLRIVDGWSTSNEGMYIDFSGYWDTVSGTFLMF